MRKGILAVLQASLGSIRRNGIAMFTSQAAEKIRSREWSVYTEAESTDTAVMTRLFDFTAEDVKKSVAVHRANPGELDLSTVNWFLPPFDNPYWGGIHTILRFADHFRTRRQVRNRFVIVGPAREDEAREQMNRAFPGVAEDVFSVTKYDELNEVPAADAVVCSMWTTAYFALRFNRTRRKFYFVQDFEPLFYPAGSTYAQAEATYRFGFLGIANTHTLADIYREYGGSAKFFTPCVDTEVFRPTPAADGRLFTVFFYGRPKHPRNCFELGAQALKLVKKELGDRVRIVSAGSEWKGDEYGLEGVVEPLGLLDYDETAKLFRKCDVGLSIMVTMHPSYIPLELMASGCLVVSNSNRYSEWLLRDGYNCLLAGASAHSISEAILRAHADLDLRHRIASNALEMIRSDYSDWSREIEKVYDYMRTGH